MHVIDTNGNGPALLSLFQALNVDDGFLSNLKSRAYSTCAYFSNDNNERRFRQKIEKSSDGLFRYHLKSRSDSMSGKCFN